VTVNMPPAWVSVSDEVSAMMARIRERLVELSALHARALLPNFDEFSGEDARVEVLTQEITRMFKRCEKNLTALAASKGSDQGDAKVRQNVVRSMAAELQKQSVDFRKKQKDYLQKLKQLQDRCAMAAAPLLALDSQTEATRVVQGARRRRVRRDHGHFGRGGC
jgi:syntaxin 16